ncbi:conserved hypothetical protein [Leishmania braziliensis MHOM/BR/75/M2904]|uniref:Uncharacterized protein n=2 Tax=Leishmania braziliensis TaxID=5660 RepID=A4HNF4_LEIBR|nr:conserved hypothetical protein [Leishmania braziliensis MHOM/BR/75/M2904]CAJ2480857.1 unnamed protein product [Leishmania braziliensis]CAM43703.1 conserved hypothetical protein [Leishmania braziliensis MHOM/BR/75/M2904]SYZ69754.1 hypothetical_protein [Leishmania braziliensis MHOM/BR/75/M2904]
MMRSSEKHQGVKAMHINRDRIKERIQEKHREQRQRVRDSRLGGLRRAESGETSDHAWCAGTREAAVTGHSEVESSTTRAPDTTLCYNSDEILTTSAVQDWSDIGHEFGVNIHDADVMEYLLGLEEEIRQEQFFQFYDQTNSNEWEEYFCYLTR